MATCNAMVVIGTPPIALELVESPAPVSASSLVSAAQTNRPNQGEASLFDGKTLAGWAEADFAGRGETKVEGGKVVLGMGYMTGITYTNPVPHMNYEVTLEAMRVEGSDFFCGLTFPVETNSCCFVVGGWGGGVVGLSSIDGEDAANNETTTYHHFEKGRWYGIRVRVTPERIEAWIDKEKVVSQELKDRKISIRFEMEPCVPFGIATWSTTSALRNIRLRRL
jgi:hypothetical protein